MKKRILWLGLSFLLVAALVLTSCGEAVPGEQEEEEEEEIVRGEIATTPLPMGIIEVYVTNPPHPEFSSIEVFIDSIEVQQISHQAEMDVVEHVISSFDLVKLVGIAEFLGSLEVLATSYRWIGIRVNRVEVNGEPAVYFKRFVKIDRPFNVREGLITRLELDFDGERSIATTERGRFIFRPVVGLRVEISNPPATGEDTTPPVIDLTGVIEEQVIISPDTVTPEFSVSDDAGLEPTVTSTLSGEPFSSGTVVSEVGEYELVVTATDASGNEAEVAVNFEIVEVEDTTLPVITLDGVTEGQVIVSPDTVTLVFSASDDIDPFPTLIGTLNGEFFRSGKVVSEVGEYELEVTAIDARGNQAGVVVGFEIMAE